MMRSGRPSHCSRAMRACCGAVAATRCSRRCSRCWSSCCSRSRSAPKRKLLARVAAPVLWLAVLLAGLLALDTLFRGDAEDGSLEQWMLAPVPLAWLVLVRTFMHWALDRAAAADRHPGARRTAPPAARAAADADGLARAGHAAVQPDRRGGGRIDRRHAPLRYPCRRCSRCRCTCPCWCSARAPSRLAGAGPGRRRATALPRRRAWCSRWCWRRSPPRPRSAFH